MASNSEDFKEYDEPHRIHVLFLASEWGSSKGGLSTINRELAINVAECPDVNVTFFVPHCNYEEKEAASHHKIDLVEAIEITDMDELRWLCFPPHKLQIDVVVGHGVKLGPQAEAIRVSRNCKWIQVVHTAPEELAMHKTYSSAISSGEIKNEIEVELCKSADFVVTVGPKLYEIIRRHLCSCKSKEAILDFTPGIFREFSGVKQDRYREGKFQVLLFGRGDTEDFELKGFDIAAKAVASLKEAHLIFVGAPKGKKEELKDRFRKCGIPGERLTVRRYLQNRESLKKLLCEADLAVMPSRTEGFGLAGLEALSAGLPILVSRNSGFGEALSKLPFGSHFVVDSNDPRVWSKAIKKVMKEGREKRLTEVDEIRTKYNRNYSWEAQSKELIEKMTKMLYVGEKDPNEERVDQQEVQPREEVSMMSDLRWHRQETHEENSTFQEQITELHEKPVNSNKQEMKTRKQHLADLHRQVQEKDQDNERLQQQLTELQGKVGTKEQEMETMRQHLADLFRQVEQGDQDKKRLQQQVVELNEKLSTNESEMRKVSKQLEYQLETLEKELKEGQQQTTHLQERQDKKKRQMETTRGCLKSLDQHLQRPNTDKETSQKQLIQEEKRVYSFQSPFEINKRGNRLIPLREEYQREVEQYDKGDFPLSTQELSLDVPWKANVLLRRLGNQWKAEVSDYGTAGLLRQCTKNGTRAAIYSAPETLNVTRYHPISYERYFREMRHGSSDEEGEENPRVDEEEK